MQLTGQTSTQDLSLTPMQGSAITNGMGSSGEPCGARRTAPPRWGQAARAALDSRPRASEPAKSRDAPRKRQDRAPPADARYRRMLTRRVADLPAWVTRTQYTPAPGGGSMFQRKACPP